MSEGYDVGDEPSAQDRSPSHVEDDGHQSVMNVVDSLRQLGLQTVVSLPQLVVCGDQSAGKSSVLDAITEVPFPRREVLCTRFATEIALRYQRTFSIRVRITPHPSRPEAQREKLSKWEAVGHEKMQLSDLIAKATQAMGLAHNHFSQDIVSIDISGPEMNSLTLVDLPGLVHVASEGQTQKDIDDVWSMTHEYIRKPRSVILA